MDKQRGGAGDVIFLRSVRGPGKQRNCCTDGVISIISDREIAPGKQRSCCADIEMSFSSGGK